jgi:hypothetical protein
MRERNLQVAAALTGRFGLGYSSYRQYGTSMDGRAATR